MCTRRPSSACCLKQARVCCERCLLGRAHVLLLLVHPQGFHAHCVVRLEARTEPQTTRAPTVSDIDGLARDGFIDHFAQVVSLRSLIDADAGGFASNCPIATWSLSVEIVRCLIATWLVRGDQVIPASTTHLRHGTGDCEPTHRAIAPIPRHPSVLRHLGESVAISVILACMHDVERRSRPQVRSIRSLHEQYTHVRMIVVCVVLLPRRQATLTLALRAQRACLANALHARFAAFSFQ